MSDELDPATESNDDSLASLRQSLRNVLNNIQLITLNPKPNYDIDGQEILWADYLKLLQSSVSALRAAILEVAGPFEIEQQGYCT